MRRERDEESEAYLPLGKGWRCGPGVGKERGPRGERRAGPRCRVEGGGHRRVGFAAWEQDGEGVWLPASSLDVGD